MASRRYLSPAYKERPVQASAVTRHGQSSADYDLSGHHLTELLENKLDRQATEIDRLTRDNKKLAASNVTLRQDLVDAHIEIKKRKKDILSIQEESDLQIRDCLDRIADIETDIRAGERIKRDLQEAESEARSLIAANCDLAYDIRNASQELEKEKKLSEMNADIDNLRQEPQKLQKTLELEKGANKEKVEQMQLMEKDLVLFAKEVERLRYKVLNAQKQAHAPNLPNDLRVAQYPLHRPSLHGSVSYLDQNGRPY
ncbi:hypothetical protein LIER_30865 [Lithospermum erythrorhizon]|uniref:Uncharacterized protein n=1 Tax=Lithospermum erythrorhizon TaxID=34254 RepID=A0AAV3RQ56_LITER